MSRLQMVNIHEVCCRGGEAPEAKDNSACLPRRRHARHRRGLGRHGRNLEF